MKAKESKSCPSSKAKSGASLLGVRQNDGTIVMLPALLPVNDSFLHNSSTSATSPEQRFRFTNKCVQTGCVQWNGKECGIANRVVKFLNDVPLPEALPHCAIRTTCQWYFQSGADACTVCKYIVTEITEQEIQSYLDHKTTND